MTPEQWWLEEIARIEAYREKCAQHGSANTTLRSLDKKIADAREILEEIRKK